MAHNADLVRVSARLSSANQYQLIETYEMFCYKGYSSNKLITKNVYESAIWQRKSKMNSKIFEIRIWNWFYRILKIGQIFSGR
jgi:hypothetical protein